ncbi:MAG: sensor histidine kinase, partial [Rhizobacter sp.]
MKLRHYLVVLVTVAALPLVVFSFIALQQLRESERLALHSAALEATQSVAYQIDRDLSRAEATLSALAGSQALAARDWGAMSRHASIASTSPATWIVVFDAAGRQTMNSRVRPGDPLPRGGAPENFKTLMLGTNVEISGVFVGPNTGKQMMRIDLPVHLADGSRYLLTGVFEASYFNRLISERPLRASWIVGVFDQHGLTVARSHRAAEFVGKPGGAAILRAARDAPQGLVRTVTREGIALYDTFVRVPRTGWVVANGVPAAELEGTSDRALGLMAAGFVAAVLAGLAVASYLAWRLTSAFRQLADAMGVIGSGELPALPSTGLSDLDGLARDVVRTHDRLRTEEAAREAAEADRESLYALERENRVRAEAENRAKDEFLAMLAHELRNPLSAVQGAVSAMARRASDTDVAFARELIGRQTTHLTRLVDDLLEVNRVLRGKIVLRLEPLDWARVVTTAIDAFRVSGKLADRHITSVLAPVWVRGDHARLEQMVGNLLANAVKFTLPGGHIRITLRAEEDRAVLSMSDDGVGMSAALLEKVFETFVQGPTSPDRSSGGLGIGLALVRQLTLDHHGTVTAHSAGDGEGATFTIVLPRLDAEPYRGSDIPLDSSVRAEVPAPACRVLLVEDQEDVREALSFLLE